MDTPDKESVKLQCKVIIAIYSIIARVVQNKKNSWLLDEYLNGWELLKIDFIQRISSN